MVKFTSIVVFLLSTVLQATILPPGQNKEEIPYPLQVESEITFEKFNELSERIRQQFSPIVSRHESRLVIEKYWDNNLVNLYAEQMSMSWFVHLFGGFARLPMMNEDTLLLSLCHEVGHHLAGFPFKSSWSTAEGQADYFATHACLDKFWGAEVQRNREFATQVDLTSKNRCESVYEDQEKQWLCFRKATAALRLTQIFSSYLGVSAVDPDFTDFRPVATTIFEHVSPQCRFETLMRGALCQKVFNWKKIPGKMPGQVVPVPSDPIGSNALWAEKESLSVVCSSTNPEEEAGARPSCWYKPRL